MEIAQVSRRFSRPAFGERVPGRRHQNNEIVVSRVATFA
jgi:hypothetical protein